MEKRIRVSNSSDIKYIKLLQMIYFSFFNLHCVAFVLVSFM